jgi:hypothetical protein
MNTKKPPRNGKGSGRRRAPQQTEISGARETHPRIEPLAKKYSALLDDMALMRRDLDQRKRLVLAAMQAEGVPVYRLPDNKHQLRLDTKVAIKRERAPRPKKRMGDGTLATVEASR